MTFYLQPSRLEIGPRPGLLSQARRGNREAFAEMAVPHVPTLYRRARRLTGNSADAEDVSQEALLKAWSRLQQFSGAPDGNPDEFRAWISRIGANSSIDLLRARRDGKLFSLEQPAGAGEETLGSGMAASEPNPEERYARREMSRMLADAIVQLPSDLRRVCLLRDVLHYSTQEVADRLGVSLMAVRLRLFRAHRRLREKMENALRPQSASKKERAPTASGECEGRLMSLGAHFACGD